MMRQLLCWILLLTVAWSSAQPVPDIRNISATDYGAGKQNWSLALDGRGILYVGNNNGLLEGDGLSWTLRELPKRQIGRAVATRSGDHRIYVGGYGEFGFWEPHPYRESVYHSLSQGELSETEKREEIWHILAVEEGVYFQSFSVLFFWDGQQLSRVPVPGNIMFLQQLHNRLLLPVIDQGIYAQKADGSFAFMPGSDLVSDKTVSCIIPISDSSFLVGTEKAGAFLYQDGRFQPWTGAVNAQLREFQLNKGIALQNGRLAFGTILSGLFITDRAGNILYHLHQENGLQNNTVLSLAEDSNGNVWAGLDQGIDLITCNHPLQYYRDRDGLIGSVFDAVVFDERLYLATNRGVFYRSWPWRPSEKFQMVSGIRGQSWVFFSGKKQLLLGHNEGTFRIKGTQAEKISAVTGGWHFRPVTSDTTRLLQGCYTGIIRFDYTDREWRQAGRINGIGYRVKNIIPIDLNTFWVQSLNEGIFRIAINWTTNQITELKQYGPEAGLPAEVQTHLQQWQDTLFAQTGNHIAHYDTALDRFVPLRTIEQPGNHTLQQRIYLKDDLFVDVFPDIVRCHFGHETSRIYPLRLVPRFERVRVVNDSMLLFCLDDGLALLNLNEALQQKSTPVKPLIKSVQFRNKKRALFDLSDISKPLSISPGFNTIYCRFGLTGHLQPAQVRYRLLPIQTTWSAYQQSADKSFFNLPPGTYTLEIQSVLHPLPSRLNFTLEPHWYQTTWIIVPYILFLLLVLYGLYRWHAHQLRITQRQLSIENERRLQRERIESRNQQLQRDVINKSKELANSTFNLIRKNELLITIRDQVRRLRKMDDSSRQDAEFGKMMRLINRQLNHQKDWEIFEQNFNQVHEAFFQRLMATYEDLTPGDLKLAACLKMNLSSKEIAPLLNISLRGVENKRYRLRKKLNLSASENLTEFMINF